MYKAFQFAIILANILVLFLPRHSATIEVIISYSSHIVDEHACARAGSHLCTRLHCCTHGPMPHRNGILSHTQVHSTLCTYQMHGYTCMWHTINLPGNDSTHTHKHCDMQIRGDGSCLALVPHATGADLGICVREVGTPPAQQGGMGEHCKLLHRGLGRSPRSQRFLR